MSIDIDTLIDGLPTYAMRPRFAYSAPAARRDAPGALHHNGTLMANTKSAKKATRKIARRTEVNKARRSRMRTALRNIETAISSGNKDAATAALVAASPALFRAARGGILHKKTASRKVSRLTLRWPTVTVALPPAVAEAVPAVDPVDQVDLLQRRAQVGERRLGQIELAGKVAQRQCVSVGRGEHTENRRPAGHRRRR